jgi:hypothetical protein
MECIAFSVRIVWPAFHRREGDMQVAGRDGNPTCTMPRCSRPGLYAALAAGGQCREVPRERRSRAALCLGSRNGPLRTCASSRERMQTTRTADGLLSQIHRGHAAPVRTHVLGGWKGAVSPWARDVSRQGHQLSRREF